MIRRLSSTSGAVVPLADLRTHMRVSGTTSENTLIRDIGKTAERFAEDFTNRGFLKQTFRLTRDDFPRGPILELHRSPLFSTTGVVVSYQKSTDAGSTSRTTFSSTSYTVDGQSEPPRVVLKRGHTWPTSVLSRTEGVRVDFEVGYGTGSSDVPDGIKHGIKMFSGHWFENREEIMVGSVTKEIEMAARSLLWQHRVPRVP